MRRIQTSRASLAAAVAVAGLAVVACGSSTVDSSEVTSTQASTSTASDSSTTSTTSTTTTSSATSAQASRAPEPAVGADQPAKEVDSVPSQAPARSAEETAYLEALRNGGINVHGVEDQLTATGLNLCQGSTITRDAVAGQLKEQRRTDLEADAAAKLIDDTAHAHLC